MRRALMTMRPFGATVTGNGITTTGTITGNADTNGYELGWMFTATGGSVSSLRVYSHYAGTVTANLWSSGGAKLGTVAISATANTWSQAAITPVALTPGANYVVSLSKNAGTSGYKSITASGATFNAGIAFVEGRSTGTVGSFPTIANATSAFGLADVIFS